MWSDESRFTLSQSDWCIRVRREVDEVMHLSCLVPTAQACWGSAMIWVAAVGQVKVQQRYVPKEWGQLTTWIYWMTRLFHQWIYSSLMARAYSKTTMPEFIRLKLGKSGSGSMRHHFHTWIGHQCPESDLNPIENLWDVLEKTLPVVRLSHHQYKIYAKNVCHSRQE